MTNFVKIINANFKIEIKRKYVTHVLKKSFQIGPNRYSKSHSRNNALPIWSDAIDSQNGRNHLLVQLLNDERLNTNENLEIVRL